MTTTARLAGLDKLADPTLLRTMSSALNSRGEVNAALYMGKSADAIETLLARIAALTEALEKIERWDMPETGKFWENADGSISDRPLPYGVQWGSRGEQQHIRQLTRAALTLKENDCE